jgi:hypothetical protein
MPQELERQPQAVERQRETVFDALAALARDPSVPVDRIVSLYDLQRRAEADEAERQFNAAFARLLPRLPRIVRRGKIKMVKDGVDKGTIPFVTIDDMDAAIRPLYTAEGFTLSFLSEPIASGISRTAILRHTAGHSIRSTMQLPPDPGPGRNNLQALGSSMTYADRYLTRGLFNLIAEGEDDDGNAAGTIGEREVKFLQRAILTVGVDEAKLLAIYGAKALSDIPKSVYRAVQTQIEAKYRTKLQNEGDDAQEISYKMAKLWTADGAK